MKRNKNLECIKEKYETLDTNEIINVFIGMNSLSPEIWSKVNKNLEANNNFSLEELITLLNN